MAASRKPSSILELSGSFAKNPKRRRVDPTPRGPIGPPPIEGQLSFAQAWNYIVECAPDGVLSDRDRIWVEITAELYLEFRRSSLMHPAKLTRLTQMLSKLGMSPADASTVRAANPPTEPGDFD